MYKRASRGSGASHLNGRAKVARVPSNYIIERAAANTPFARRMLHIYGSNSGLAISSLSDYDLALLVMKFLDSYTGQRDLLSIEKRISENLDLRGCDTKLSDCERRIAEVNIPKIIQRWAKYRVSDD